MRDVEQHLSKQGTRRRGGGRAATTATGQPKGRVRRRTQRWGSFVLNILVKSIFRAADI